MYEGKSISLVIPAYNEEEAIGTVIRGFQNTKLIDEIIVVDNNSTDKTVKIAKKNGAIIVKEKKQGYGFACIKGLKSVNKELVVLVEGDDTFDPSDLKRLLTLSKEYDMILGSRTVKGYYSKKSVMNWYIRFGNYCLAILVRLLYKLNLKINDVGCTYRVIKRKPLELFVNKLHVGGAYFTPELTIEALKHNLKVIQIPVNYLERKGKTKLSRSWVDSFRIGLAHIGVIIIGRFTK